MMSTKNRAARPVSAVCLAAALIAGCGGSGGDSGAAAVGVGNAQAQANVVPYGGPLAADMPLAKAYDEAAKAMAATTDNPILKWEYRVWCQTGYRTKAEGGTGQPVDLPLDPTKDLVSPTGFLHTDLSRVMPAGGVQFMDNAWYFGTDLTGMVVVRTPDGNLVMFDALTTAGDMQTQTIDQMKAIGLDPARVTHIFIGHEHSDHYGGIELIKRDYAPNVRVIATAPAAQTIASARARVLTRTFTGTPAEQLAARNTALFNVPEKIDIIVKPYEGYAMGMQRIPVANATDVVAMLAPGHTPGQLNVVVPVNHQGKTRKLLIWSGNDNIDVADQYAASTDFVQGIAFKEGTDSFINTHGYQGAVFGHLRNLKANPSGPNPLLMGVDGLQRYFSIYANCQRAEAQRLRDGTWKAL